MMGKIRVLDVVCFIMLYTFVQTVVSQVVVNFFPTTCQNGTSQLRVSEICQYLVTISIPPQNQTDLSLSIAIKNGSLCYGQLSKPNINISSTLITTKTPYVIMSTDIVPINQFDRADVDFGTIKNTDLTNTAFLYLTFQLIPTRKYRVGNDFISINLIYSLSNKMTDIMVIKNIFRTHYNLPASSVSLTNGFTDGNNTIEKGTYGFFRYNVTLATYRSFNFLITVSSTQASLTISRVLVENAGACYAYVNSVKDYFAQTTYSSQNVTLNLNLVNTGFYNSSCADYSIGFIIFYRVSSDAASTLYTIPIVIKAAEYVQVPSYRVKSSSFSVTAYDHLGTETDAPAVTITGSFDKTIVNINEGIFKLSINTTLPINYKNFYSVAINGNQRFRIISFKVTYAGYNLPTATSLNSVEAILNSSILSTNVNIMDSLSWIQDNIMNFNLVSTTVNPDANLLSFEIIFQLVDHSLNLANQPLTITPIITTGTKIASDTSYIIGITNETLVRPSVLWFNLAYGDNLGSVGIEVGGARSIYFDVKSKQNGFSNRTDVVFRVAHLSTTQFTPICSARLLSVGRNLKPYLTSSTQFTYQTNYDPNKIDQANTTLEPFYNQAADQSDIMDGTIRLAFSTRMDASASTDNKIIAATKYAFNQIFVGSINLIKSPKTLNSTLNSANLPFSYLAKTNDIALGDEFAIIDYFIKIPPKTSESYSLSINLTDNLTSGYVRLCGVFFSTAGANVACIQPLDSDYSSTPSQSLTTNFGQLCNINPWSSTLTRTNTLDEDTIGLKVITRPSKNAVGSYTLYMELYGLSYGLVSTQQYTCNAITNTNTDDVPTHSSLTATLTAIDPNSATQDTNYTTFYKGQVIVFRYNLTLNEAKSYRVKVKLTTNLPIDQVEIQNVYISYIGRNLPCTKKCQTNVTYQNGLMYAYQAEIDIGTVCVYPEVSIDPAQNTISIDAHFRIPNGIPDGLLNSMAGLIVNNALNDIYYSKGVLQYFGTVLDPALLTSTFIQKPINVTVNTNRTEYVGIRQKVTKSVNLVIAPFVSFNLNISVSLMVTGTNSGLFGYFIKNLDTVSVKAGANIDGWLNEYYNAKTPYQPFISNVFAPKSTDSVIFGFGIVTNTQYTAKNGISSTEIDNVIQFNFTFLTSDHILMNHLLSINNFVTLSFNNISDTVKYGLSTYIVNRMGNETPVLDVNATILNSTDLIYESNSQFDLNITIQHNVNSTAYPMHLTFILYLPKFVVLNQTLKTSADIKFPPSPLNGACVFEKTTLTFEETSNVIIRVTVDPNNQYLDIVRKFGYPVGKIDLPYYAVCRKVLRSVPIQDDPYKLYRSPMLKVSYRPVNAYTNLIPTIDSCQLSASDNNELASSVFTTGWMSDFKSLFWLNIGLTYVQISFGNKVKIGQITLGQLNRSDTSRFTEFSLSYSDDNFSFTFLAEQSYPKSLSTFNYTMPGGPISCRYLRIHITKSQTGLNIQRSGFTVKSIFGGYLANDTKLSDICTTYQCITSVYYAKRSVLYSSIRAEFYICNDFNTKRPNCYKFKYSSQLSVQVLPKIVSNVVFYARDYSIDKDYLYALANDKQSYLRSDDFGLTFKSITECEFKSMMNKMSQDPFTFDYSFYTVIDVQSNYGSVSIDDVWSEHEASTGFRQLLQSLAAHLASPHVSPIALSSLITVER